jgi:transposase
MRSAATRCSRGARSWSATRTSRCRTGWDELGTIFSDEDFADLFPQLGQPGLPPWRLALITILQFRENLADRQAAEAVRARIDWKYLLGLELADPGFDHSVLCEFRARLGGGGAGERLLHKLLERCRELGLLKARSRQRTDATHVLAAIRVLNRWSWLARPCARPSTNWPRWYRTGCAASPWTSGTNVTRTASRTVACR